MSANALRIGSALRELAETMEDKPSRSHTAPIMAYTTTEDSSDFSISVVSQKPTDLRAGITAGPNMLLDDPSRSHAQVYGWDGPHRDFSRGDLRSFFFSVQDLGQGSHGFVDEVKIPRGNFSNLVRKRVIVKGLQGQKKKQVIEQEARILGTLNHPHIVTFIGSYSEWENNIEVGYSLLMTPVGDCDLKTFFETLGDGKDRRHSEKLLWVPRWFGCLASALKYIHKQNIRHEDIKPSNIIHRGPDIFFTDFSSAGRFAVDEDSSTESLSRCTARYAAPEVGAHLAPDEKPQTTGRSTKTSSSPCCAPSVRAAPMPVRCTSSSSSGWASCSFRVTANARANPINLEDQAAASGSLPRPQTRVAHRCYRQPGQFRSSPVVIVTSTAPSPPLLRDSFACPI